MMLVSTNVGLLFSLVSFVNSIPDFFLQDVFWYGIYLENIPVLPCGNSSEEFSDLDVNMKRDSMKAVYTSKPHEYSFVLSSYIFYSSLVMHFIGFSHKFIYTDPELQLMRL